MKINPNTLELEKTAILDAIDSLVKAKEEIGSQLIQRLKVSI